MAGSGSPNVLRMGDGAVKVERTGDVSEGKVVERVNEVILDECPWPRSGVVFELFSPELRLIDAGIGGIGGDCVWSRFAACCLANDDAIEPLRPLAP